MRLQLQSPLQSRAETSVRSPQQQRGASLVEVLVSVLLLSFCMLGIAGLMGATTRFQLGVQSRTSMTMLLGDAAGRIRANGAATQAYLYAASWETQQNGIDPPAILCTTGTACAAADRAAYDLWELRTAARRNLPQGSLQIAGNTSGGLTLTYLWMDKDFTTVTTAGNADTAAVSTLAISRTCTAADSSIQAQSCCPSAAAVRSTPGVRCMNMSMAP